MFQDRYQLFVNTLSKLNNRLTTLLSLLDWTYGFKVSTFLAKHRSAVLDVVDSKKLNKEFDSLTSIYYLPRSEATKLDIQLVIFILIYLWLYYYCSHIYIYVLYIALK